MYDPRPSICNICNGKVVYEPMKNFNITSFQSGYYYYCIECGAFVGTHKNRPKEALGSLANAKTRKLRVMCHKEFDKHWMTTAGKNRLYYKLSQEMEINKEDCHFGYMDEQQLEKAYEIMKNWENVYYR